MVCHASRRDISVVVPQYQSHCADCLQRRELEWSRTVAAGPVKAVSTGRLTMSAGEENHHRPLKCEVEPIYSDALRASSTFFLNAVNAGVTALLNKR